MKVGSKIAGTISVPLNSSVLGQKEKESSKGDKGVIVAGYDDSWHDCSQQ